MDSGPRFLLVDDSEDFLAAATPLLESQGLEIAGSARTSAEALELAATLEPDIALVDIELADEDGVALAHELRARSPSIKVVLISSYDRDDLGDVIADSSAVGFLSKRSLGAAAIAELLGDS